MAEHIILFAGPMGAGKTTAIKSLSEINVISTEAANTERETADKDTTTVALDYGEITLGEDDKIRLYGVPGQKRFDFMWQLLKERAMGLVLLLNSDAQNPVERLREFLLEFGSLHARGGIVVGITRTDVTAGPDLWEYSKCISETMPDCLIPVFTVDARSGDHMRTCLLSLVLNIESRGLVTSRKEQAA